MKSITFYFDPISPYAYLAFKRLPVALQGLSYTVRYKPVLFAGMLKHFGQLGPAEIAPKRDWTYRQVLWQAREMAIAIDTPATHPFNPLPLLRLATALADEAGCTNRFVTEQIFNHVWLGGAEASDAARVAALAETLQAATGRSCTVTDVVKERLKTNTDEAIAAGCFGVPSLIVDGKVFWGLDALPMLRKYLEGDAFFESGAGWETAGRVGAGVKRA